jgi:hypothetical protein
MKSGDIVEVIKIGSFANTGTLGWFGVVQEFYIEYGKGFVLVRMQGERTLRLYSEEDLVVIKTGVTK